MSMINQQQQQQQQRENQTFSFSSNAFRLSKRFLPRRYDLLFAPRPVEGIMFGSAVITIEVAETLLIPTNCITLHALKLYIETGDVTVTIVNEEEEESGEFIRNRKNDKILTSDIRRGIKGEETEIEQNEEENEENIRRCVKIRSSAADETITLEFNKTLPNELGAKFMLRFSHFTAIIQSSNESAGLFFSNTRDMNFLATHLEPTNARRLFPCFDEPSFRAIFQVTVEFESHYNIISGTQPVWEELIPIDDSVSSAMFFEIPTSPTTPDIGKILSSNSSCTNNSFNINHMGIDGGTTTTATTTIVEDDFTVSSFHQLSSPQQQQQRSFNTSIVNDHTTYIRRVTFDETPLLSTYVIGFNTGKFHIIEKESSHRQLLCRVIFASDKQVNQGWYALDLLTKAVDFFDEYYDFPLPLQKLDLVGLLCFHSLGMENWGMITMHQEYLLVDELTSLERRQRIARLIGHEVAHQWLGDWAAIEWWKYLWMKEGLCRYLEFTFVDAIFPSWCMWDEFLAQILDDALTLDVQNEKTHPVQYCDDAPRRIEDSFDSITYGKGASILRMLFSLLGRDRLQVATHLLLQRCTNSTFNNNIFLNCVCGGEQITERYEVATAILHYAEECGHPLLYIEEKDGICKVKQYHAPDLRKGILFDCNALYKSNENIGMILDLMSPRRTREFVWDADKFLQSSNYIIPVSIIELQHGASSFARTYIMRNSEEVIKMAPEQLIYFNYRGAGVLRCDYDTNTWKHIFEIAPFFSSEDRMIITMTLFRFRNIHIGHDASDASDRCTLLLEWLLIITQSSFINSSQWKYITENIEQMAYMVRDYHCWSIFSQFVTALYTPLVLRGAVSFALQEKAVSFESQTNLSRSTVLHILQVLAICRSPMIYEDSKQIVDWALTSLVPEIAMNRNNNNNNSGPACCSIPFNVENDFDATAASIAMQALTERGDLKIWWILAYVMGEILCLPLQQTADELHFNIIKVNVIHLDSAQESRWINLIAPAVFALDASNTLPFLISVLQCFARLNMPIAKAILRNKRLVTKLFEPNGVVQTTRIEVIRRLLIMYGATFCSDGDLISLMKTSIANDSVMESYNNNNNNNSPGKQDETMISSSTSISNAIAAMEINCMWMDYCCDYYYTFLSRKQFSQVWGMPHSDPQSYNIGENYTIGREGVSI